MMSILAFGVLAGLVGVFCFVGGWLYGRKVLGDDPIACQHCPPCDCEPDCSRCSEITAQEMSTGVAQ